MVTPVKDQLAKGHKFGRWTVIGEPYPHNRGWSVQCRCVCGTVRDVHSSMLLYTKRSEKSCGCFLAEVTATRRKPDSKYKHPVFNCWRCMMDRCYKPSDKGYSRYGGRGIRVDDRWHTFENFRDDMSPRLAGHTLERKDNSRGYSKSNCKWATPVEQARNTRKSVHTTIGDRTMTPAAWSEVSGLRRGTIACRIRNGWEPYEAVYTKSKQQVKAL